MADEPIFELDDEASSKVGSDDTDKTASRDLDKDNMLRRFKKWWKVDKRHSGDWRKNAAKEFDMVAGEQWSEEDKSKLRESFRPVITFNRMGSVIGAVSGTEVTNRQEVRFFPRETGDAGADEMLTGTADWFRDECNAEDEESDAFWDCLVCGMGWTETRMDFETDPDGAPFVERVDPLEMFWDASSRKANVENSRRVWRVKKVPLDEARALVGDTDADDADFDAKWADFEDEESDLDETVQESRFYRPSDGEEPEHDDGLVTLVELQWWERETVHVVADGGGLVTLSAEDFETMSERLKELKIDAPKSTTQTRRKYYRAWIGRKVLADPEEAPFGNHFSYQAITGYRDRNKGTFYGLARAMIDPQCWANKWLSQTMHILNTNAKGGWFVEDGVFEDMRDAEKTLAMPDKLTKVAKKALSSPDGPKIQPKPQAEMPQGFADLMQFAISSIRDASGVNLELLGQKDTEQAGVLEMQRKKQAMSVLAVLFSSLRRYRKNQGKLLLWLIQNFVSEGRLIRINGEQSQQYIPYVKNIDATYDVIVDDAPSNPQQKEITWAVFMQMAPVLKDQMTPELWSAMLQYSPLPESASQKLREAMHQSAQQRAQMAQGQQQLAMAGAQAQIAETQSKTQLNQAKAAGEVVGAQRQAMETQAATMAMGGQPMNGQPMPEGQEMESGDDMDAQSQAMLAQMAQAMAVLAQATQQTQAGVNQLTQLMSQDIELVRDPASGRAIGARRVRNAPIGMVR